MTKKPLINKQIRAKEVRVIDETGKQLGVILLEDAIKIAQEKGLDLIQVTEMVEPPVCKIMDFGKYLYQQRKKEKSIKTNSSGGGGGGTLKGIRISFGISQHDLEVRANQAVKFLKDGNKVRIEMRLRGREKALGNFAKEKIYQFLENLSKIMAYKIEKELKREMNGLNMIISKG